MGTSFITLLLNRIKSKSPKFFKKIQFMGIVVGVLIGLLEMLSYYKIFILPDNITSFLRDSLLVIGGIVSGTLPTTNDPTLLDTEVKQKLVEQININPEVVDTPPITSPKLSEDK